MPRNWNDILRAEETIGGFQAGSSDDETFMADMIGGFPGDVPYDYRNAEEKAASQNAPQNPEPELIVQEPVKIVEPPIQQEAPVKIDAPLIQEEAPLISDDFNFDNDIDSAFPEPFVEPAPMATAVAASASITQQEEVSSLLDDDLLQMLQDDLDKTKPKLKKKDKTQQEPVVPQEPPADFKPVEEQFDTETIDISSLAFDKPSNSGVIGDSKESPKKNEKPEKKKKEKVVKPPKIKKERKPLPRKVWYIAAALLLLALLASAGYVYWTEKKAISYADDATNTINGTLKKVEAEQLKKEKEDLEKKAAAKRAELAEKKASADSAKSLEKVEEPKELATAKVPEAKIEKPKEEKKIAKEEPVKKAKPEPKIEKEEQKVKKPVEKKQVAKAEPKEKKSVAKAEKKSKGKAEKKVDSKRLYVVQLFSTPLKDDAEQKLKQVKKKWSGLAFIQEQKIKDQVWRQVRIGNFSTKEEAENAAREIGAEKYWIDRVR